MKPKYHSFTEFRNYQSVLNKRNDFMLVVNTHAENLSDLPPIVADCIASDFFHGIIFNVDPQKAPQEKLIFFKKFIEKLLISNKKVGIWGATPDAPKKSLGRYFADKFSRLHIPEPIEWRLSDEGTILIIQESENIKVIANSTPTSGRINVELPEDLSSNAKSSFIHTTIAPFDSQYHLLNQKHGNFVNHIVKANRLGKNRVIFYTTNIDFGSEHSYPERFIYVYTFDSPEKNTRELDFIKTHCLEKKFIDLLELKADLIKIDQIGYCLAQRDEIVRESFYVSYPVQLGESLVNDFGLDFTLPPSQDMNLYGLGMDVKDGGVASYKLYFRSHKSFLNSYTDAHGIDAYKFSYNRHDLVLRYDGNQTYQSYKIEFKIKRQDLKLFSHLIDNVDLLDLQFDTMGLFTIALEFEDDQLSKMNLYHLNKSNEKIEL